MKTSELKKKNPWKELSTSIENNNFNLIETHSLEMDNSIIDFFNRSQSDIYKLRTSMLPAHFTGNILESKIVLLASNPGFVEKEVENFYCNPKFIKMRIEDLTFAKKNFISNDIERVSESPYWNQKLRWVIDEIGFENTSKNISLLQFNPYHSIKFKEIPKKYFQESNSNNYLPSQNYGFELLRNCISQGKLIVVLRSKKAWFNAVSELIEYEKKGRVITIKNKRQPTLSPNNFETENGYNQLITALKTK